MSYDNAYDTFQDHAGELASIAAREAHDGNTEKAAVFAALSQAQATRALAAATMVASEQK